MYRGWKTSMGLLGLLLSLPALAVPDVCDDGFATPGGDVTVANGTHLGVSGLDRNDYLGKGVAFLDFNGDGVDDLLVGAPGADDNGANAGAAYVFFGPVGDVGLVDAALADVVLVGSGLAERAGWTVANAGDLDGDGDDEALIGAAPGPNSTHNAGIAYLVAGGMVGLVDLGTQRLAVFVGEQAESEFGSVVAGVGDVNGDGWGDVAIGAPRGTNLELNDGHVRLFLGPLQGEIPEADADARFVGVSKASSAGIAIAGVGDVDGDSLDDFVVGAARDATAGENAGAAYLLLGDPAGLSGDLTIDAAASAIYTGAAFDRAGASVAHAGDVNGDGLQDFFVGAKQQGASKRGAVYLIRGEGSPIGGDLASQAVAVFRGASSNDLLGSSVAGGHDINGDGFLDVVIGAERADGVDSFSGAGYLFHGPFGTEIFATEATTTLQGAATLDFMGSEVALGDLNGDGHGDAAIASWQAAGVKLDSGIVGVFLGGADDADLVTWYADSDNDQWGDATVTLDACSDAQPAGFVASTGDCDDGSPLFHPGATEGCLDPDFNCDSFTGLVDNDGDSYTACEECDDSNPSIHPDADELCGDGIDNNCDGLVDDGSAADAITFAPDLDFDGYGDDDLAISACDDPGLQDAVNVGGDCDDGDNMINPDADEYCGDAVDNDCDGQINEASSVDALTWYADADLDGAGDPGSSQRACTNPGAFVPNAWDCDDSNPTIQPGAIETCDLADNDCDGVHYMGGPVDGAAKARATLTGVNTSDRTGDAVAFLGDQNNDGFDELVVGAPQDSQNGGDAGAVYVYYGAEGSTRDDLEDGGWDARVLGTRGNAHVGAQLASADFTGDGIADLIIGAWGAPVTEFEQGAVYVFFGPVQGDHVVGDADLILRGPERADRFGTAVTALDFDCDGTADLAVSAPGHTGANNNEGGIYLVRGGSTLSGVHDIPAVANAGWFGGEAGGQAGSALAGVDFDLDGCDDLVVGSPLAGGGSGKVDIVYGGLHSLDGLSAGLVAGTSLPHDVVGDGVGISVAAGGDVNGDGNPDILVGTEAAQAHVLLGFGAMASSGDYSSAIGLTFQGTATQRLGEAVAGLGDVNGDGMSDMAFSAHRDVTAGTNAGAVVVIYGAASFGAFEDPSGAVDANAVESFARLAAGTVFPTWSASNRGLPEGAVVYGDAAGDQFGTAIAGGGDFNGDGYPDLTVGAPRADMSVGTPDTGRAYLLTAGPHGIDNVDSDASMTEYLSDADADTYGDTDVLNSFWSCPMMVETAFDEDDPAASVMLGVVKDDASTFCDEDPGPGSACDCDDNDPTTYPGAEEIDDGVDHDCDGYSDINHPPEATVVLSPDPATNTDTLLAVTTASDANGDALVEGFMWTINSVEVAGVTTNSLPATAHVKHDTVSVYYTVDDGRGGVVTVQASVDIINTPPTLSDCSVTPESPSLDAELDVVHEGLSDVDNADSSLLTVAYQWQQRFGPIWSDLVGESTTSLASCEDRGDTGPTGQCRRGTQFRAECVPSDPEDAGLTYVSNVVTIDNSAPQVTLCELSPTSPTTLDDVTLTAAAIDADDDVVVLTYVWEINGQEVGYTGTTLPASETSHFDVVRATCVADDQTGGETAVGTAVQALTVTVVNSAPTAPGIDLLPDAPKSEDQLSVTIPGVSTDVDVEDSLSYNYYWTRNGAPFNNPTYPTSVATVGRDNTARGDVWEVTVAAYDGTTEGPSSSDLVAVGNTPPVLTGILLAPFDPITSEDVSASVEGWYDEDGDPSTILVQWFVNGVEVPGVTGATLPSATFVRDDEIYAIATATDPFGFGMQATSGTLTVVNATPSAPVLAISPNPPGEFDDLTCNVTTASIDPDGDTVTYLYNWYSDTGKGPIGGVTLLEADTDFGESWYCTAQPNDGAADGDLGTSPSIAIQDISAPPAPTLDTRLRYRNSDTVSMSGTCTSGSGECNQVRVDCVDGLGSADDSVVCLDDVFVTSAFSLTRGQATTCTATCVDISLNESLPSNGITTESCDPEDTYEGGFGSDSIQGDDVSNATNEAGWLSIADTNSTTIQVVGNIVDVDDEDWFKFITTNDPAWCNSASPIPCNLYNFAATLGAGSSHYRMEVYIDNLGVSAECPSDPDINSFNHYWSGALSGDACGPGNPTADVGPEQAPDTSDPASSSSGQPPAAQYAYDHCANWASTYSYYVRVLRDDGLSDADVQCNSYRVDVNNGAAKP